METSAPKAPRLLSLDALRGFDLFWIVGGHAIFLALHVLTGWEWLGWANGLLKHVEWHGFLPYDLIFPLFLFLAGVSTPFSLSSRLEAGARREACRKVVLRGLLLVLLGIIYNNGLQWKGLEATRFGSVLGRIGLAGMFAQLIYIFNHHRPRRLWYWLAGVLAGYFVVMKVGHAPGFAAGDLSMQGNFASYVDRLLLPGRLHKGVHDPEGLLATVPAIGNALLGVLAGLWLRRSAEEISGDRKARGLVLAGLGALAVGAVWDVSFPINKNLWTSSFVLWTSGWSALLLAFSYWTVDVRGWLRRPGEFFAVIGANSVFIYMAGGFISFSFTAQAIFGGVARGLPVPAQGLALAVGAFAVKWALLWLMKRKQVFLRV
ncbi:MAG: acyltransferase family protein [Opitutales bacterium]